jgi:SAM-dependent methyltransferase
MEGQRNKLFIHILDIIEQKVARGKLLDVGTGCGFFLRAAKARGWDVRGIEPSGESVEIARQHGVYVLHGTLQDYKEKEKFDVITFVNVLEYSALPWMEIDRAKRLLKNGGLIYVRFVNGSSHSLLHTLGKKFRLSTFINKYLVFHFYSFKPKFIKRVLHDKGFKNITILNSPLTEGDPNKLFPNLLLATYVKRFIHFAAKSIEKMTCRQLLLGTSLEVTAKLAEYS